MITVPVTLHFDWVDELENSDEYTIEISIEVEKEDDNTVITKLQDYLNSHEFLEEIQWIERYFHSNTNLFLRYIEFNGKKYDVSEIMENDVDLVIYYDDNGKKIVEFV